METDVDGSIREVRVLEPGEKKTQGTKVLVPHLYEDVGDRWPYVFGGITDLRTRRLQRFLVQALFP